MIIEKTEFMWLKKEIDTCKNIEEIREIQISINDLYITFPDAFTLRLKKLIYFYIKFKFTIFLTHEELLIDKT